jgi:hypothetical protein
MKAKRPQVKKAATKKKSSVVRTIKRKGKSVAKSAAMTALKSNPKVAAAIEVAGIVRRTARRGSARRAAPAPKVQAESVAKPKKKKMSRKKKIAMMVGVLAPLAAASVPIVRHMRK